MIKRLSFGFSSDLDLRTTDNFGFTVDGSVDYFVAVIVKSLDLGGACRKLEGPFGSWLVSHHFGVVTSGHHTKFV